MNDLEQLLAQLAEAKKEAIENHPGKKLLLRLQEDIKSNNPFLSANPPKETNEWIEEELIVSDEPIREVIGEYLYEDGEFVDTQMLTEIDVPEIKPASQVHSQAEIDKYLRRNASFQQPDPDKVDPNFKAIQEKIKFLEQSIGKIATLGPGSGETKLRYLDDVNRSSIQNNRYLRYDQATSKFVFDDPNVQLNARYYGSFSDTTDQFVSQINTPYAVTMNRTELSNGHSRGNPDTSRIIAANEGKYDYMFSVQLVSSSSSAKNVWIWARKNGVDVPDSATKITITGNNVYTVAAWNFIIPMIPNDYFQLMWAADNTAVHIAAPAATSFCPAIPSVLLSVDEVAK